MYRSQKLRQEIEENNVIEFEDGRLTHFLFHKKTVVDLACSFFYVAGLILAIIAVIYISIYFSIILLIV